MRSIQNKVELFTFASHFTFTEKANRYYKEIVDNGHSVAEIFFKKPKQVEFTLTEPDEPDDTDQESDSSLTDHESFNDVVQRGYDPNFMMTEYKSNQDSKVIGKKAGKKLGPDPAKTKKRVSRGNKKQTAGLKSKKAKL